MISIAVSWKNSLLRSPKSSKKVDWLSRRDLILLGIGFIIGILSGFLGVGGGVFLVPIMVTYLAIPQQSAHATSLLVVLPTAIAGSFVYSTYQQLDYFMAMSLALGAMSGAAIGAHYMKRIPAHQLKRAFGFMLLLVGLRMAW